MKRAVIAGVTGQDGVYLTEFLLKKGYELHGINRCCSLFSTDRIDHLYQDSHEKDVWLKLHCDLKTSHVLPALIRKSQETKEGNKPFVEVCLALLSTEKGGQNYRY